MTMNSTSDGQENSMAGRSNSTGGRQNSMADSRNSMGDRQNSMADRQNSMGDRRNFTADRQSRLPRPGGPSLLEDLNIAVRDNPLAAGLIGMGALWMVLGGSRISAIGGALPSAVQTAAKTAVSAGSAGTHAISSGIGAVTSRVSNAVSQASDAVTNAVGSATQATKDAAAGGYNAVTSGASKLLDTGSAGLEEGQQMVDRSADTSRALMNSMQRNLGDAIDRQPLLLGVLGVAVGAGIASMFAATETERRLMGEQGAAVKDRLGDLAHDAVNAAGDRIERMVDDVRQEAGDQSLTPAAAKEQFEDLAGKVANVAGAARDSVKSRLS